MGLFAGAWVGGETDRYSEEEGVLGDARGARDTIARGYRYTPAVIADCLAHACSSVRNLGLGRQIEIRLWQDKHLAAEGIVVEVEEGGKAVLTGQVPDSSPLPPDRRSHGRPNFEMRRPRWPERR